MPVLVVVVVVVPAPLVDVDVKLEEDVAVGELGFGRGDGVPVDDMAAWEQRVPLQVRGGMGQGSSAP